MPANFSDLFANRVGIDSVPPEDEIYSSWRLAILPEDEAHIPPGFAVVGAGAHPFIRGFNSFVWRMRGRRSDRYKYMLFPKQHSRRSTRRDARHIDLEYGRIPAPVRAAYVPLFAELKPVPEVMARADDWWEGISDASVVGVQVRTWRDAPKRYRKYHLPARRRLLGLMKDQPSATRFLVVSDSDEFVDFLRTEFDSQRILSFSRTTRREESWETAAGIREDLIDMLLLSRCDQLFASYLSTFSEVAWWLGGARAAVTVF